MAKSDHNCLLVEGIEDKRVIPHLMDCFITWGDNKTEWPTIIEEFGGVENLLMAGVIEAKLKTPGLEALGILIDADVNAMGRWQAVRERCVKQFPMFPKTIQPGGLILSNADGLRLGVWIMPDNAATGMLETFLSCCLAKNEPLWQFAEASCVQSAGHGAKYKQPHLDKAKIHTWLAWQDPPGQSLHIAIISKALQPGSPYADPFVQWFRDLFQV